MRYGETAIARYGLVITPDVLEMLVSKISSEYDPEDYADSPSYYSEPVINELEITRLTGFTGEAIRIAPEAYEEMVYSWDEIMFIPVQREISPFYAAYKDFGEMVDDVSFRIRRLLPDSFDYAEYVRYIVGTCDV